MQELSRHEEELYQMTDAAAIADRNARMRANRIPEVATFPPEQERLYGYDSEAVLRAGWANRNSDHLTFLSFYISALRKSDPPPLIRGRAPAFILMELPQARSDH